MGTHGVSSLRPLLDDVSRNVHPEDDISPKMDKWLFESLGFETEMYPILGHHDPDKVNNIIQDEHDFLTRKKRALDAPCLLIIHYVEYANENVDRYYAGPKKPQYPSTIWQP
jgi:hypothetical protein